MKNIVIEDTRNIIEGLGDLVYKFENKKILVTGYKGFLGSSFTAFFALLNREVLDNKCSVTCMDNSIVDLEDHTIDYIKNFKTVMGSGISALTENDFNYIVNCAGIASPTYYRRFPLETISVNAIGFWEMLNSLNNDTLDSILYFSTSEIYGDPNPKNIPTKEDYRGNVSCIGPRACYDESKRLGETISETFYKTKNIPVKIVRPFNVFGPFMRMHDKRVIPDFLNHAISEGVINILSDGSPTRSFCYTSDAIEGFIRAMLIGESARPYNIGNDNLEVSMLDLAHLISEKIDNVNVEVTFKTSKEKEYLTNNPMRRCPDLSRSRKELGYSPQVSIDEGLDRIISWYKMVY